MKVGSAESTQASTARATVEENDGAFADLLVGVEQTEEPMQSVAKRQHVGADQPNEDTESDLPNPELELDVEVELAEGDVDAEVRVLTEPKRSFWERAAQAANDSRTIRDNRALSRPAAFDVKVLERQASLPQNEAVVPGPRSANVPPMRPPLSPADAALPSTVRPGTTKPESVEVKKALQAPMLPQIEVVEESVEARPARPAPSPPMSVSLQLATIAHDVLARAAQVVAPEAAEVAQMPAGVVTLRPAPIRAAGQDAFIHIEHPVLGKIRLQLVLDARNLTVRAVATSAAAVAALRESEESMREDVARHGVDLESLRVDLKRRGREKK